MRNSKALQKAGAVVVSALVLGLQLWAIVPRGHAMDWYWPFMDYPMYSRPHFAGETFRQHDLRLVPCRGGSGRERVQAWQLGVEPFMMIGLLRDLDTAAAHRRLTRDSAETLLGHLVSNRWPGSYCTAQLWQRGVVIGAPGPVPVDPLWQVIHTWPIPQRPER